MNMEETLEARIRLPTSFSFLYNTLTGIKKMIEELGYGDVPVDFDEGSWEIVIRVEREDE